MAIKADIAEAVKQWASNKLPKAPVFNVPKDLIKIFDKDLKFAKIPKTIDDEVACVHSLRHSFASMPGWPRAVAVRRRPPSY